MKASIIIPAYNAQDTIEETIESALAQTHEDTEVIVVDDQSDDNTYEIAMRAGIRVIMGYGRGVAHARNLGANYAIGDVILPLDADDTIEPTYLEKTIPLMVGGIAVVSTGMKRFGDIDDEIRPRVSTRLSNNLPITSLIRRDVFYEIDGYDPEMVYEDWDLWLRILERGWGIATLNYMLFNHRVRPGTRNAMQDENQSEYRRQIRERHA